MLHTIELTQIYDYHSKEEIKKHLNTVIPKTSMNFDFTICPSYGYFSVCVTGESESEEDLKDMLLSVLIDEVIKNR